MSRPRRKKVPLRAARLILDRQGFRCAGKGCDVQFPSDILKIRRPGRFVRWDHRPPLEAREILPDGSDYVPAQLDPAYIDALCPSCHDKRTFRRSRATTLGSDAHTRAKVRRLRGLRKPRRKSRLKGHGFDKARTRHFDGSVTKRR